MAISANSIEEYYKLATRRLEELEEIAGTEFETEADVSERNRLTQALNSIRTEILQGDTFTIYNGNFQGFNFERATYERELSQLEGILTNRYDELVRNGEIIEPARETGVARDSGEPAREVDTGRDGSELVREADAGRDGSEPVRGADAGRDGNEPVREAGAERDGDGPARDTSAERNPETNEPEVDSEVSREVNHEVERLAQFMKDIRFRNMLNREIGFISGYSYGPNLLTAPNNKLKDLRRVLSAREANIKQYISDFATNPDNEISDNLRTLIGQKDGGGVYVRPTIKQHLEPIEELEDKIQKIGLPENDESTFGKSLNDEERKKLEEKLKKELEEKRKKLGKKWELKLKIEKQNREIKSKKAEIRKLKAQLNTLPKDSPERKELEEKIAILNGEIEALNMGLGELVEEYGNCLAEIANEMEDSVKKRLEKKIKESEKNSKVEKKEDKSTEPEKENKSKNGVIKEGPTMTAEPIENPVRSGGAPVYGGGMPAYSGAPARSGNISAGSSENLPAKRKKLKDRISDFFNGKSSAKNEKASKKGTKSTKEHEADKEKLPEEVLYSEELKKSYTAQYALLARDLKDVVDGKYLYYLRVNEKDNKLEYVKMPLQNFDISEEGLTNAIAEMKGRMYDAQISPRIELPENASFMEKVKYKFREISDHDKDKKIPGIKDQSYKLYDVPAKKLAKKMINSVEMEEQDERILATMCAIQAANFRNEACEQLDVLRDGNIHFDEGAYRPNIDFDKKGNMLFNDSETPNPVLNKVMSFIETRKKIEASRPEAKRDEIGTDKREEMEPSVKRDEKKTPERPEVSEPGIPKMRAHNPKTIAPKAETGREPVDTHVPENNREPADTKVPVNKFGRKVDARVPANKGRAEEVRKKTTIPPRKDNKPQRTLEGVFGENVGKQQEEYRKQQEKRRTEKKIVPYNSLGKGNRGKGKDVREETNDDIGEK